MSYLVPMTTVLVWIELNGNVVYIQRIVPPRSSFIFFHYKITYLFDRRNIKISQHNGESKKNSSIEAIQ